LQQVREVYGPWENQLEKVDPTSRSLNNLGLGQNYFCFNSETSLILIFLSVVLICN
jgi:hypothetical protein